MLFLSLDTELKTAKTIGWSRIPGVRIGEIEATSRWQETRIINVELPQRPAILLFSKCGLSSDGDGFDFRN